MKNLAQIRNSSFIENPEKRCEVAKKVLSKLNDSGVKSFYSTRELCGIIDTVVTEKDAKAVVKRADFMKTFFKNIEGDDRAVKFEYSFPELFAVIDTVVTGISHPLEDGEGLFIDLINRAIVSMNLSEA